MDDILTHPVGGRPQVVVNNWTGPAPAAPSQPDSRGKPQHLVLPIHNADHGFQVLPVVLGEEM